MINYELIAQNYFIAFIWVFSIIGYGFFAAKILRISTENSVESIALTGFLGLAFLSIIVTIINFFVPINFIVSSFLYLAGLIFFVKSNYKVLLRSGLLLFVLFFVVFAFSQIGYPMHGNDTAGYHYQCVKWIKEFNAPIGIVHINERLASNNSLFMIAALTEMEYFKLTSIFTTNGFFVFFWCVLIYASFKNASNKLSSIYMSLSVIIVLLSIYKFLGTLYLELSTAILEVLIIYLLIKLSETKQIKYFYMLTIFACFAVTIKLSTLIFAFVAVCCGLYIIKDAISKRLLSTAILIAIAVIAPWCFRSIAMSGTILYPVAFTILPLEWSIDAQSCKETAKFIMDWARFGYGYAAPVPYVGFEWVLPWVKRVMFRDLDINRTLAVLGAIIPCIVYFRAFKREYIAFFVPIIFGLAYWFFTAPDPRFAFALILSCAILCIAILIVRFNVALGKTYIVVLLLLFVVFILDNIKKFKEYPISASIPGIYNPYITKAQTKDGYVYYILGQNESCADAPLPCGQPNEVFVKYNLK